jgi:Ca-activated chloride channel family protein
MAARWFARLTAMLLLVAFSASALLAQGFLMPEAKKVDGGARAPEFKMPRADMALMVRPRPFPLPRPQPVEQSYKIKEITMDVSLVDQIAKVQVSQTFQNTGNIQMECSFIYPLPYDGAVESLTFMVDGKEFAGKLLSATEARGIYESYVRRNIDPALMEWIGTGMFKTSVFPVPPGKERKVTLKYSQLCRKQGSITETRRWSVWL